MKLFQGNYNFCNVEPNLILGEVFVFEQVREELAALNKIHDEIKLLGRLKCVMKCCQERTVDDFLEDLEKES